MVGRASRRATLIDKITIRINVVIMSFHERKRPAQGVLNSDEIPTLVFLTVCTDLRGRWLANHETHQLLRKVWLESTAWAVGIYVLMPDHLHLFAWPYQRVTNFDNWVRYWKSQFTRRSLDRDGSAGVSYRRWQSNCFHHRIRSFESAEQKRAYILANPVQAGLVTRAEDWPYQGELFKLGCWW